MLFRTVQISVLIQIGVINLRKLASTKSAPPTRTLWRRQRRRRLQRLRYIYANLMGRLSAATTTDAANAAADAADLIFNMLKKRPTRQHRCHRRRRCRKQSSPSSSYRAPVFIFKSALPNEKRQFIRRFRGNVYCWWLVVA